MKFVVCYCWPRGDDHLAYAYRFINSYAQFPPQVDHETVILTDPGELDGEFDLARSLPKVSFFQCNAPGKDLSRYFAYCEQSTADVVIFLGGTTYCRRTGWGLRAATSFQNLGSNNLYGSCGHTGAGPVRPHIRTTGFWASPAMMRRYPMRPMNHAERYGVEHGTGCLSDWFAAQGNRVLVVTFNGEWDLAHANDDPNGYARGNQSSLLLGDRLTAPPYQPNP